MARRGWLVIGSGALVGGLAALAFGVAAARSGTTGPPVSTGSPTASGMPGVGKTVRTTNGSWSTSATFTYQWLRCVKGYRGCANLPGAPTYTVIPGATAATYRLVAADVGHVVEARVTATNAAGSASGSLQRPGTRRGQASRGEAQAVDQGPEEGLADGLRNRRPVDSLAIHVEVRMAALLGQGQRLRADQRRAVLGRLLHPGTGRVGIHADPERRGTPHPRQGQRLERGRAYDRDLEPDPPHRAVAG